MSKQNFYVTTPIYYPTASPHLGSLYSTLLADVAARWHALQGHATFLLTGTDEHGQKIAQAAQKAGVTPQAFVDQIFPAYESLWKSYGISYNHFMRTSNPQHAAAVQKWIELLKKKGDIYKGFYQGWYCTHCETFVTEVVEGDQAPACPTCGRETHKVSEESYFFRLSAYQDKLLDFYKSHPDFIVPRERGHEVIKFVEAGLKDLSISRTTIKWGIPFPGDAEHVVYVWADALNNYITAIGWGDPTRQKEFEKWWPATVQVLGKDILRFHAIFWPAFLMAVELPFPKQLLVHGWIKVGAQKMSKSLGNALDPQLLGQKYGIEPMRYYLVRSVAITHDHEVSDEDIAQRITADLANDLGNLLNRMLALADKHQFLAVKATVSSPAARALHEAQLTMINEYSRAMNEYHFHHALAALWKFIGQVNAYFHAQEPWKLVKADRAAFEEVIAVTCHSLRTVALLLWPVMPATSEVILGALGQTYTHGTPYITQLLEDRWDRSFALTVIKPIFAKIEIEKMETPAPVVEKTNHINFDDWTKIDLRVGTVTSCQTVPKSDKLYQLAVDFGALGTRQILSGVRKDFAPEDLIGKQGVFVYNLAPRMMLGLESQGMMLFSKDENGASKMITVSAAVTNGSKVL
jgi:methionyl-tRNA synthetase